MNELKITLNDKEVMNIKTENSSITFEDKEGNMLLNFDFTKVEASD